MRLSWLLTIILSLVSTAVYAEPAHLLNVSYDPTREFYDKYNVLFAKHWKETTGQEVVIEQSHGGSGKQARSVIDGLKADVVTLALAYDIDVISEKAKLLPADWQSRFPNNSSPYTSTIVFLVRKGNPKNIKDWDDLVRDDVKVVTPNPKTSGGARWNYLAAWSYAQEKFGGDEKQMLQFMKKLFKNVPVLDTGARGATTTFAHRGMGDVLIAWENEAFLAREELAGGGLEIIAPSISILAEPPVAVVEKNTERNGNTALAKEYLKFLYSPQAQELAGKYYYRPSNVEVAAKFVDRFQQMHMVTIGELGGWNQVQQKHFADGGMFDKIYGQ